MNRNHQIVKAILIILLLIGCSVKADKPLSVIIGKEYIYACNDGSKVKARFGELSDKSLPFVKIVMPDGKEYTLPQLVSASGARYSNEYEMEFWIKEDNVTISTMNDEGKWIVVEEGKTETN
jgi:membrane-bound inhibitor of C-type lysozyme